MCVLDMAQNNLIVINAGTLGIAKYPFIDIATRSTLDGE